MFSSTSLTPAFTLALPCLAPSTSPFVASRSPLTPRRKLVSLVAKQARWTCAAGPPSPSSSPSNPEEDDDDDDSSDAPSNPPGTPGDSSTPQSPLAPSFFAAVTQQPGDSPARSDDGTRDSEFDLDASSSAEPPKEENELFNFVKSISPPELVQRFTQSAPPLVQNAIRETLVSMLGSLPPLAFSTSVSTMSANLVQLFHSSLVTGYMFRNATYRLELTRSLDLSGLKALPSTGDEQPEIKGGVAVFKQSDGTSVEVPVEQYISELRNTVNSLRSELQRERKGGNELLSFISTMDKESIDALTTNAGDEVVEAMKKVCEFVTKTQGIDVEKNTLVEASAPELGQLLFYLMVSGFFLREAEVRLDLQRQLGGGDAGLKNLLEGGTDSSQAAEPGEGEDDGKSE